MSVTKASPTVTGLDTRWTLAGINQGATFRIDGQPYAYEVKSVISDTKIELATPYDG